MTTRTLARASLLPFLALGVAAFADEGRVAPDVPPALAVPDGQHLFLDADAVGVQIYECLSAGWVFRYPQATLYDAHGEVMGTHYAGPTWEGNSGGTVVGQRVAGVPSPDPSAIPWLLLRAVSTSGPGAFGKVASIQRLDTMGGIAPPAADCNGETLGTKVGVPYTAHYYFYR